MLKIIAAIVTVIIAAILLLQIDDDLNPEIAPFLAKGIATEPNDAYFYLMGIDAPADKNPLEAGKKKYAAIDQTKSHFEARPSDNSVPQNTLALPEGQHFNFGKKEDYLNAIFSADDAAKVLAENAVLLERYQTFIKMEGYQTLTKPDLPEELPNYAYLNRGNRLFMLKAMNTAKTSGAKKAVALLVDNISALRLQLQNADNLLGKIVCAQMISENLDAVSILTHQQKTAFETELAPVSLAERSLEVAMSREFYSMNELFIATDKNPERLNRESEFYDPRDGLTKKSGGTVKGPAWLRRMRFKPNMSANQMYGYYKSTLSLSKLEPAEFALALPQEMMKITEKQQVLFTLRNPVGNILVNVAVPAFEKYAGQILDLNAKIAIFNQTANKAELPTDLSDIQNPYYDKAGSAYYSEDKKSICLTGPFDDDDRCLRVRL